MIFPRPAGPERSGPAVLILCLLAGLLLAFGLVGCGTGEPERSEPGKRHLEVTATAYTSQRDQTMGNPFVGAWGDRLVPGMKAVAVSRDLLEMGLGHDSDITISGLPGTYRVLDKMNRRWTRRIDIYFGTDTEAARDFGKRKVVVSWTPDR